MALKRLYRGPQFSNSAHPKAKRHRAPALRHTAEMLERRLLLSVSILNNGGNGYSALSFNQSGGFVPPDTCGAAGPSVYVETVNQTIAIYNPKSTGAGGTTDGLPHFLFTRGGLTRADSGSTLSDPIVVYDEQIGRFIVGDQDVNFTTHVSTFDLAVSRSSSPSTLTATDWVFYRISTTQSGFDADYPGNFGYNADALVFTLNMFSTTGPSGHTQVVSVKAPDLFNAVAAPQVFRNNLDDFSVRPTTMHTSAPGDPMWLVTEHGDNSSIDVYKMTGVLSAAAGFAKTNLAVTPYDQAVSPLNPDGSVITTDIDSRILKSAEQNNLLVATHIVGVGSTQDAAQWYAIDLSSGTPALSQQGRISAGDNTYITYPGIDINPSGALGISYMRSGTDAGNDFMSMWVTGRLPSDADGTMETPVLVPGGTGLANYQDFSGGRAGDLSGINVDPTDGTFWAANEFANTQADANWGTAVANFIPVNPAAPTLLSTQIDDGNKQRSLVRSLTFTFSTPVTLSAGAITLALLNTAGSKSGTNDGAPPTDASAALGTPTSSDGGLTWVVPIMSTSPYSALGSLLDGVYTATVHAGLVTDAFNQPLAGGDQTKTFHRLFGDINGDKRVNASDYLAFSAAFGSNSLSANYNTYFDYNHDGRVNATDYLQFSNRFGKSFIYT
ncbi:MAG: hypothetical protein JWN51_1534 [Phycisphaerales bacterium]|nr:hypothetical protein [Phycisphaerales bacterium]